jgi:hypothetical protein
VIAAAVHSGWRALELALHDALHVVQRAGEVAAMPDPLTRLHVGSEWLKKLEANRRSFRSQAAALAVARTATTSKDADPDFDVEAGGAYTPSLVVAQRIVGDLGHVLDSAIAAIHAELDRAAEEMAQARKARAGAQ